MKRVLAVVLLSVGACLAQVQSNLIESWTGLLVDAECRQNNPLVRCAANAQTQQFALQVPNGRLYPIDPSSVPTIRAAMPGRTGDAVVTVYGQLEGGAIRAESAFPAGASRPGSAPYGASPAAMGAVSQSRPKPAAAQCLAFGLKTPAGKFYQFDVPPKIKVRTVKGTRKNIRRPERMTIAGTVEGNTLHVDSITLR